MAASAYLEPGSRWAPMMNAVFSYISGARSITSMRATMRAMKTPA